MKTDGVSVGPDHGQFDFAGVQAFESLVGMPRDAL
jgi:hypothetical protein